MTLWVPVGSVVCHLCVQSTMQLPPSLDPTPARAARLFSPPLNGMVFNSQLNIWACHLAVAASCTTEVTQRFLSAKVHQRTAGLRPSCTFLLSGSRLANQEPSPSTLPQDGPVLLSLGFGGCKRSWHAALSSFLNLPSSGNIIQSKAKETGLSMQR